MQRIEIMLSLLYGKIVNVFIVLGNFFPFLIKIFVFFQNFSLD